MRNECTKLNYIVKDTRNRDCIQLILSWNLRKIVRINFRLLMQLQSRAGRTEVVRSVLWQLCYARNALGQRSLPCLEVALPGKSYSIHIDCGMLCLQQAAYQIPPVSEYPTHSHASQFNYLTRKGRVFQVRQV